MKRWSILLCLLLVLSGCAQSDRHPSSSSSESPSQSQTEPVQKPSTIRLVAVGDNLIHDVIYKQAQAAAGGDGYDFSSVYKQVAPLLKGADIALINQETIIDLRKPPRSYPQFNSPREVGDEIVKIGFNMVTQANNHMFDMGETGLMAAIDFWKGKNIPLTGAYESDEDLMTPRVVERDGIKVAFVGITQYTNGLSLPADSTLRYVRCDEPELIKAQLSAARKAADIVVAVPHWGEENTFNPTPFQRSLAQNLADWGADLVIGHHPHTIQPALYLTAQDGRKVFVVYSLGNFVSAMSGAYNMMGLMTDITLKKDSTGAVTVEQTSLIPLVTHYGAGMSGVTILPLATYTPDMAHRHGVRQYDSRFSYQYMIDCLKQVYGANYDGKPIEILP